MLLTAQARRPRASMSLSASSRRTAAPRPRRCWAGSRWSRAARSPTRAAFSPRWTSTPFWRGGRSRPRRRACSRERPRKPAPEALSRCRGTARGRDRCLCDGEHPACREPQRRRRAIRSRGPWRWPARLVQVVAAAGHGEQSSCSAILHSHQTVSRLSS